MSLRCSWTFTTAENPVESNYLRLFFSLPSCCCSRDCKRWQLQLAVTPPCTHTPLSGLPSSLCKPVISAAGSPLCYQGAGLVREGGRTPPFWRDVEKANKCGLNDVHFNDLFAFVQKCWPGAVFTFEVLQKQTPAALIPSITYFPYIIREMFLIKINRMKKNILRNDSTDEQCDAM